MQRDRLLLIQSIAAVIFDSLRYCLRPLGLNQAGGSPCPFSGCGSFPLFFNLPGFFLSAPLSFKIFVGVRGLPISNAHFVDVKISWAARC
jgi:hypothetical protein